MGIPCGVGVFGVRDDEMLCRVWSIGLLVW